MMLAKARAEVDLALKNFVPSKTLLRHGRPKQLHVVRIAYNGIYAMTEDGRWTTLNGADCYDIEAEIAGRHWNMNGKRRGDVRNAVEAMAVFKLVTPEAATMVSRWIGAEKSRRTSKSDRRELKRLAKRCGMRLVRARV